MLDRAVLDRDEAEKAARGLESIFLQMLIKDMRKNASAMGGEGFFGKGVGSGMKEDLFDSMLAERISKTGRIGLADSMLRDWEEAGRIPPREDPLRKDPLRKDREQTGPGVKQ